MVVLNMEQDMEVLSKLTEDQKIAFMKAFSRLAAADGYLDEEELSFIKETAQVYGVSKHRIDEILKIDNDEEVINAVKVINNRRAALELIKEMCILAHADDVLSDQETLLIGRIGQAMGIELEKIEQISNWIIDRIIWLEQAKIIFEEVK